MSNIPEELKYTKEHEWIKIDGEVFAIGITDHAQESLGDITFIELPAEGDNFSTGDIFGVLESVKAASDLFMPVSGEVIEINNELEDSPEKINNAPYTDGWLIKIKVTDTSEADSLLTAEQYSKIV